MNKMHRHNSNNINPCHYVISYYNTDSKCNQKRRTIAAIYYKTNYRKASENDSTAHFVMQYGAAYGMLRRPRILDVFTMRLPPPRFISGRNVCTTRHVPNTLTSNSCVMSEWLNHSSGPIRPGTPTLLTMPHNAVHHIHTTTVHSESRWITRLL